MFRDKGRENQADIAPGIPVAISWPRKTPSEASSSRSGIPAASLPFSGGREAGGGAIEAQSAHLGDSAMIWHRCSLGTAGVHSRFFSLSGKFMGSPEGLSVRTLVCSFLSAAGRLHQYLQLLHRVTPLQKNSCFGCLILGRKSFGQGTFKSISLHSRLRLTPSFPCGLIWS